MKKSLLLITTLFSMLIFLFNFDEIATNNKLNVEGLRLYEKAPESFNFSNSFELKSVKMKNNVIEELCKFADENKTEMYINHEYSNQNAIETTDIYLYTETKTMLKNVAFNE